MCARCYQRWLYHKNYPKGLEKGREWKAKNGLESAARRRKRELRVLYGMSIDEYNARPAAQRFVCAICKKPDPKKSLSVDHDHRTKKIRGLLCHRCNLLLGYIDRAPEILAAILVYYGN